MRLLSTKLFHILGSVFSLSSLFYSFIILLDVVNLTFYEKNQHQFLKMTFL